MYRMSVLTLLAMSCPCWADLIPPPVKKVVTVDTAKINVPITVTYSIKDKDAKSRPQLVIPKKLMTAAGFTEGEPRAAAPVRGSLFAGLALAATFVTGGLWLIRRGGKGARSLLVLFLVSGAVGVTAFLPELFGNVAPLPDFLKKLDKPLPLEIDGKTAKLGVDIVIVGEGDRIQLILPEALAPAAPAKPADAPKKAE